MASPLDTLARERVPSTITLKETLDPRSRRMVERRDMDMKLAGELFFFYHRMEPLLTVCREVVNNAVFSGDMRIQWGGGDIDPITLNSPDERDDLESLFKTALDYRNMFGMVPVQIQRSATPGYINGSDGRPNVWVPPFGAGKFVSEYDKKQTTVWYVIEIDQATAKTPTHSTTTYAAADRSGQKKRVKVLPVFVWPGHEPSRFETRFRSKIGTLRSEFVRIESMRINMLDADFDSTHPTVWTQMLPDTRTLQDATEEELLGGVADPDPQGPEEARTYRREVMRARQQEALVEATNNAALAATDQHNAIVHHQHQTIDDATGRAVDQQRTMGFGGVVERLPIGEVMAPREVRPVSRTDLLNWVRDFRETVCLISGVPMAYVTGSGGTRIKGEAEIMSSNVAQTVAKSRKDIDLFYGWAYDLANRRIDNEIIAETLMATDSKLRDEDLGPDERQRLRDVRSNIGKITRMPSRVRVMFSEDPIRKKIDINVVNGAVAAGALTELELANLYRAEMGLVSIDEDHELMRNRAHNAATVAAELASATVTPGTTKQPSADAGKKAASGGSSGGSSSERQEERSKQKSASSGGASETKKSTGSKRTASESEGKDDSERPKKKNKDKDKDKKKSKGKR